MAEYIAGKCNIGPKNRAFRAIAGILLLILIVLFSFFLNALGIEKIWKIFLLIPSFIAVLLILEAWEGFCVFNARRHKYDLR